MIVSARSFAGVALLSLALACAAVPGFADTPDNEPDVDTAGWECRSLDPLSDAGETAARIVTACDAAIAGDDGADPAGLAEEHLSRGVAKRRLGDMTGSLNDLSRALEIHPTASAYRMRAWTYRETGQYAKAESDLTASLALEEHWQGHLSRCVVRLDMGEAQAALSDCERTLLDNENEDSLYFTSLALTRSGSPQRAIAVLARGFEDGLASDRMYAGQVEAMRALGMDHGALLVLQEARRLYPESKLLAEF